MNMSICIPSTGGHEEAVELLDKHSTHPHEILVLDYEGGYLEKLQKGYTETQSEIIAYFHSDCFVRESGWDDRVLSEFRDQSIGIVAFNGALRHGHPDIYKLPYDYRQLARSGFISNLSDAEAHGVRNRGEMDVAVVDSFSLIIRRELLDRAGGWPVGTYPPNHVSDYWACLMAHRLGYRVRFVGVACEHTSGGVRGNGTFDYPKWAATTNWGSDEVMHREGHRLIYEEFRDVLPVRIG